MITRGLLVLLVGSLVIGQAVRFPLPGQGGGILLSDVAVVLILLNVAWVILETQRTIHADKTRHRNQSINVLLWFIPFIAWSLLTLIVNTWRYDMIQLAIAGAYWVRLSAHLLLLPALLLFVQRSPGLKVQLASWLSWAMLAVAIVGFSQMIYLPDLSQLQAGWDPHPGRLTSTWLDPNFVGLFFAMGLLVTAAEMTALAWEQGRKQPWETIKQYCFIVAVLSFLAAATALLLTQSRSTLIAAAASMLVLSPLLLIRFQIQSTIARLKVLWISLGGLALLFVAGWLLRERALGLLLIDPTAELRLASLAEVWQLAQDHSWLGVGYNGYQFVAEETGISSDATIHSRAGADSSLLTLWVTTGVFGVSFFLLPWVVLARKLAAQWLSGKSPMAAAALLSIGFVGIHSLFINSWLYAHIIIVLALVVVSGLSGSEERYG